MENETSVQDSGSLDFSFDPNYQELQIHRVAVHRAGKEALDLAGPALRLSIRSGFAPSVRLAVGAGVGAVLSHTVSSRANP